MFSSNQTTTQLTADRLERLKKLIDKAKPTTANIAGKNIIMIIGTAGSGTDILASRLEGKKLLLQKDSLSDQYRAIDEDYPSGRHISTPRLLKVKTQQETFFCECPEFSSNQAISEDAIAKSITLESAINKAKQVRGIIFTIDYSHFVSNTLENVKQLISTLNTFLPPNSKDIRKSVAFVVLQKPNSKSTDEVRAAILKEIAKIETTETNTEPTWWSLLKNNLIIIDFKDMTTSINAIVEKTHTFSEIKPVEFNFTNYDHSRKTLIGSINNIALEMELAKQLEEKIKQTKMSIEEINALEENNKAISSEIEKKGNQRISLREEIRKQREVLKDINKEDLVKRWFEVLNEERNPIYKLGFAGYSEKKFAYDDIPFDEVKLTQQNGYFVNEVTDKEKGKYSVTYKSHFGYKGDASVEIYVKQNRLPENKEVIQYLQKEIDNKTKQENECSTELNNLLKSSDKIEKKLSELRNNTIDTLQLIELEMKLSRLQQSIASSQDKFETAIKYFDDFKIPQPDFADPLYHFVCKPQEPLSTTEALHVLSTFAKKPPGGDSSPSSANVDTETKEADKKQVMGL